MNKRHLFIKLLISTILAITSNVVALPRIHYGRCDSKLTTDLSYCRTASECDTISSNEQNDDDFIEIHKCKSNRPRIVCCPTTTRRTFATVDPILKFPQCGRQLSSKIYGGVKAGIDEFPWMALLFYNMGGKFQPLCGGSVIHKDWILTAAHCIYETQYTLEFVRLGEWDLSTNPDEEIVNNRQTIIAPPVTNNGVARLVPHPKYNKYDGSKYDIGLVRLSQSIKFDYIVPICLPTSPLYALYNVGTAMDVSGWGVSINSTRTDILQKTVIQIAEDTACSSSYLNFELANEQFCGNSRGTTTCHGDSGGPFMVHDNAFYVSGIVSMGIAGCNRGAPVIGIKVYHFIDWIRTVMRD